MSTSVHNGKKAKKGGTSTMDQKAHTAHFIYSCVHFLKFVCSSQKLCALLKDLVLTSLKLYVLLKVVRVVLKRSEHKKKEVSSEPSRMDQKAQRKAAFADQRSSGLQFVSR